MIFNSPLISPKELHSTLTPDNFILLDCTIDRLGESLKEQPLELIPGTLFFDLEHTFSDETSGLRYTLPSPEHFQEAARNLGINNDSVLILYDRWGIYSSPRVWWMFHIMGHTEVYVLNGGLPSWKKLGYPLSKEYITPSLHGDFAAHFSNKCLAGLEEVKNNIYNQDVPILDARGEEYYNGIKGGNKEKGINAGHIPNAINLPFTDLLDENGYKDLEMLKNSIDSALDGSNEKIYSCGGGITACILAFAEYLVTGEDNFKVYDGSWTEWGQEKLNLPIEK